MDNFKRVLFNDGEGLVHDDLNNMQAFNSARLLDQYLSELRRNGHMTFAEINSHDPELSCGQSVFDTSKLIFALTAGGGFIIPGGSSRQIRNREGTILQWTAAPDGDEEKLLSYRLAENEVNLTLDVGDATHPRIDIIEVKLELVDGDSESRDFKDAVTGGLSTISTDKTRRVSATIQVKKGTPAATPSHPNTTSGFASLGAVHVPATHNAVFPRANLMDTRFPLGLKVCDVPSWQFDRGNSAAAWVIGATAGQRSIGSSSSSDPFLVHCPIGGQTSRVIGVSLFGTWASGSGSANLARLVRLTYGAAAPTVTEIADQTALLTGSTPRLRHLTYDFLMELGTPGDVYGLQSVDGVQCDPIWTNGWRGGPIQEFHNLNAAPPTFADSLALEVNGKDASEVWMARWYIATGL
jgi:hypothetical protein